ncbi:MAG: peptidylprolyl isomerase [Candidatus Marinimicrobia bacterium]|nr:peptidylprolyl isomerase [Candidatus Neomarinimicrobiota bacterium]
MTRYKLGLIVILLLTSCSRDIFSRKEQKILSLQNQKRITKEVLEKHANSAPQVQKWLAIAAANSDNNEVVPALIKMYKMANPEVRKRLAFALSQFDLIRSKQFLSRMLTAENNLPVKRQIVFSLGKIGNKKHLELMLEESETSGFVITPILRSIGYFFDRDVHSKRAIEKCFRYLNSKTDSIRMEAATTLTRLEDRKALKSKLPQLLDCFASSDQQIQVKLVKILNKLEFNGQNQFYQKIMRSGSTPVKLEAVKALPYLNLPDTLIINMIDTTSNNKLLATLLEHIPVKDNQLEILESEFNSLIVNNSANHVKGLALQHLCTLAPLKYKSISVPKVLLPYKIEGLARSKKLFVIDSLDKYARASAPKIYTPAYRNLLSLTDYFVQKDSLKKQKLEKYIIAGLKSRDPVKVSLAARQIRKRATVASELKRALYDAIPAMIKCQNSDAMLEIIQTIQYLYPQGAVKHLWPLLECDIYCVHKAAAEVLTSLYNVEIEEVSQVPYSPPKARNLKKVFQKGGSSKIEFETEKGNFIIAASAHYTPFTYSVFLALVEENFYDGLTFHRVVPNFVVQGGDPRGDGWGGLEFNLMTEISPRSFKTGSVGLANAGQNTEGSQFFITTSYQPHLDYNYTRFGEVVEGMNVVQRLENGDKILSAHILP